MSLLNLRRNMEVANDNLITKIEKKNNQRIHGGYYRSSPIVLSQNSTIMTTSFEQNGKYGLCNEDKKTILEAKYDKIEELSPTLYLAYMGNHPLVYRVDRNDLLDFFQIEEKDFKNAGERIMNWVLPGLQLFYRDTDSPVNLDSYHIGDILRAGIFTDVSPYAGKPLHKYRYIIASSHAAKLCEEGEKYPIHTFHYNSYFKVMDIYEKEGITQICLLHVPAKSIFSPMLGSVLEFSFNGLTFTDIARKSLDTKLNFPVRENLEEDEWLERTREHIGISPDGELNTLFPALTIGQEAKDLGKFIRQMANDTDPINIILNDGL